MTPTGHVNHAAERAFWLHRCKADRSAYEIEPGAECNWCGATESQNTSRLSSDEHDVCRPDQDSPPGPVGVCLEGRR